MKTTNWTAGDVARDPRDGETVEVIGPSYESSRLYDVKVIVAARLVPSHPSALVGETTRRELNDPDFPFERVEVAA